MALTEKLSAIGEAIRKKTGKEELLTLDQMPGEIGSIETGGSVITEEWQRPSNWPDLSSLGIPEPGTIYLTYDCRGTIEGREAGEINISALSTVCHVQRGYIQNGEFIPVAEVPNGQELLPTDAGDFVVYRVQTKIYWAFNSTTDVYGLYKQPCVEVYGAMDATKGDISNTSYQGIAQRVKAFTMYGYNSTYSLQSVANFTMDVEYINTDVFDSTTEIKNFSWTFAGLNRLKRLKIPYNTSGISDFGNMFRANCSVEEYDLSAMDTSEATNISYMFADNYSLKSLDISHFNTSKVTNFTMMFSKCLSLYSVDFRGLDTSAASGTIKMFSSCRLLTDLKVGKITTSFTFEYCDSLSRESLLNVINALETTDTTLTLTIGKKNLAKLTESEIALATEKGWTVA